MILILDFYVDEPACFGVPPYLSPYCRYVAGALVSEGIQEDKIDYLTVDQWRAQNKILTKEYEVVFLIAGTTVPGKYLGGKIGTVKEILEFLDIQKKHDPKSKVIIGGPIRFANPEIQKNIIEKGGILILGDIEKYAELYAKSRNQNKTLLQDKYPFFTLQRNFSDVDRYAKHGAFLTTKHPNYPYLMIELETYRGCTRERFCSFCTEAFYGKPQFRSVEGILEEVGALYHFGNRYFRLGRQADIYTYLPDQKEFKNTFPRPNPESIRKLYEGIRRQAPDLKVLHLDNVNPGLLSTFPEESREISKIITTYNTPGDTAAMGIESIDPVVIQQNDLKCNEEEAIKAIEIINEYGAQRKDGLPILLPGLNFIHGLMGETEKTFELNYRFLLKIKERGLLLRRINIRQVMIYRKTKLYRYYKNNQSYKKIEKLHNRFLFYRDKIRKEIDHYFLKQNFPKNTILREVILEYENAGYYFGRQLGSYPITVKIPKDDQKAKKAFESKTPIDVVITGWEERSIHGLTHPIEIQYLGWKAIQTIPNISKRGAYELFLKSKEFKKNPVL
ncbi:MAG: radical SAM protein [Leptospiraceae bacterium]|nr:radical SAM protein [Leptospiraceae bacterium]MDW7974989.1 radical SAM protein [Leptospiraceae bacterium]